MSPLSSSSCLDIWAGAKAHVPDLSAVHHKQFSFAQIPTPMSTSHGAACEHDLLCLGPSPLPALFGNLHFEARLAAPVEPQGKLSPGHASVVVPSQLANIYFSSIQVVLRRLVL